MAAGILSFFKHSDRSNLDQIWDKVVRLSKVVNALRVEIRWSKVVSILRITYDVIIKNFGVAVLDDILILGTKIGK